MDAAQPAQDEQWSDLQLPKMDAASLLRQFGPGMILMMTGIGTSHLVTAPTAGGRFGYALLWCIPVAYISKYYGFEMAFRFTNATGKSLIEAYGTAWKKWPLWYVLITTLLQSAIGQAGRLIAAAAVLYYLFSASMGWEIPLAVYGLLLGTVAVAVILKGSYQTLESGTKVLAGILFVSTMVVYLVKPAPLGSFSHFFLARDTARLVADHRRFSGSVAHRRGCFPAGFRVGQGQKSGDGEDPRKARGRPVCGEV